MIRRFLHKLGFCHWDYLLVTDKSGDTIFSKRVRVCKLCKRSQWELWVPAAPGAYSTWVNEDESFE